LTGPTALRSPPPARFARDRAPRAAYHQGAATIYSCPEEQIWEWQKDLGAAQQKFVGKRVITGPP
jgi:hypothetical protein